MANNNGIRGGLLAIGAFLALSWGLPRLLTERQYDSAVVRILEDWKIELSASDDEDDEDDTKKMGKPVRSMEVTCINKPTDSDEPRWSAAGFDSDWIFRISYKLPPKYTPCTLEAMRDVAYNNWVDVPNLEVIDKSGQP